MRPPSARWRRCATRSPREPEPRGAAPGSILRAPDDAAPAGIGRSAAWFAGLGTAALAVFLVLRLRNLDLALHVYFGYLAGLGVVVAIARAGRWAPPGPPGLAGALLLRWRRRDASRPERARALEELEHAVDFSRSTAFDVHYRLRPHLARVAAHRLAVRRGIDLERQPDLAAAALGPRAWDIVRPDREPPADRNAPGLPLAQVEEVLDALEAV